MVENPDQAPSGQVDRDGRPLGIACVAPAAGCSMRAGTAVCDKTPATWGSLLWIVVLAFGWRLQDRKARLLGLQEQPLSRHVERSV